MIRKSGLQLLTLIGLTLLFTTSNEAQTLRPRPLITQPIQEHERVKLSGNTRPEAHGQNDLGAVKDDFHLDMYLQLKRSPELERSAAQFVESLTDKSSPNFHKWITAAEYGRRFGASEEDIATVSRWLESHGFTVNGVPANNMAIDFSGNAGQVREALHTEIHNLEVAGKRHFANVSDPEIPAALLPAVTGVVSLHNFMPHSMLVPKAQYTVNSREQLLVPGDVATIYNLNPVFAAGYTGRGQTIVLIEDTDLYNGLGDWTSFRKTFGLTQYQFASLQQVHPAPGKGGSCGDPGINGADAEAALDVQWASAAAPDAAIVMASCADTSTTFGGFIALQNLLTNGGPLPSVVSISYGESETANGAASNSFINTLYQTAAAAGVSVFVSSGDSAAAGMDRFENLAIHGVNVSAFASTVYNVAVGGTDFGDYAAGATAAFWNPTNGVYYDSARSYVPEIPWNDSCGSLVLGNYYGYGAGYGPSGICNVLYNWLDTDGGSGGPSGCATGSPSLLYVVSGTCAGYAKPSWQSIPGNPNDGLRDLPDVSLFAADGIWGHYLVFCLSDGGSCSGAPSTWAGGGGTSFASPIMAGIQAVINQAAGLNNVGNPNPVYYQIGQNEYGPANTASCNSTTGPDSTCSFNDITQGDIMVPCAGAFNCYLGGGGVGVLSTSNTSYAPAYAATPGWDFATGIGSVNAYNLLTAFVSSIAPANPPAAPQLVSPADGTSSVSPTPVLAWSVSTGATAYDVYFGTASPPPLVGSTANLNYAPGTLSAATTYYWAVGARNSLGANVSPARSFTVSCVAALSVTGAAAPSTGGTGSIPVTAGASCAWTAVSNATWITITSGASGNGSGTVVYSAAPDNGVQRSGTITIAGQTFTVAQTSPLISTLAGQVMPPTAAPGTSVSIPVTYGIAADSSGNTYFPSPYLNAVFKADPTGMVTRVAGTGVAGSSGDGGPALSANLYSPYGVAVDAAGNLYISDSGNYRIRKVDGSGNITTVAGSGAYGFTGDGQAATGAEIGFPYGLAVDGSGNLYITDISHEIVRKVDTSGIITTVAGSGTTGYSGDGQAATSAKLYYPTALAVDASGNLYIADRYNYRIRMVSGGTITTVAGTGTCCYSGDGGKATSANLGTPVGVALDSAGNLYIADSSTSRIRMVSGGIITTVAGTGTAGFSGDGGRATSANLYNPLGVAVDASGNLYIPDVDNERIRVVSKAGIVNTLVGGAIGDGGLGVFGFFNQPLGVARDAAGNTYIADSYNNRVRKIAANGVITTVAGTGALGFLDNVPATGAKLSYPTGVAVDGSGNLYIADVNNYRVRKVDASGNITTVAGNGTCCGTTGDGGPATNARIGSPYGVTLDASGNLYIADTSNNVIRKVDASGTITTIAGSGTSGSSGDGGPAISAKLSYPAGVAVDASGNLYVADRNNYRVRMISPSGTITTVAGTGNCCSGGDGGKATSANLDFPAGVAVDTAGNLYIADGTSRIRLVSGGIITTIAGAGSMGYSGDGGPATSATFQGVSGIAVDAAGMVAFIDLNDNAVRLLTPAGTQPVLTVRSSHTGAFAPASAGTYTVTVRNALSAAPTAGAVTVTETLPAGWTLAGMSGDGWTCAAHTCSRGDSLAGGSSYPPITVTVNVGAQTQSQATNLVSVSGGGASVAGSGDFTLIAQPALLTVTKTHNGNFVQGQVGAIYTVTVSSTASANPIDGPVNVTDNPPPGLTLVSMAGDGWSCASNTCSRSDSLAPSSSYPSITVTVNVASNAASRLVNAVSVTAGGSAAASATDSTIVAACSYTLNPGSQSFTADSGAGTLSVTTSDNCAWTAVSGLSWVAITGGGSGAGSGTVSYQVAANAGGERSGSLAIAGHPFPVDQAGLASGLGSAGSIAQIESGGAWNSTITLLNTGTTAAQAVLNFYDDNGNPLVLPLVFPETSSTTPLAASTVNQTIGAGAQLVIQTAGTASQTALEGWAQLLTTGGNVGGSAVLAWAGPGGMQQASVPVETRNPSAFVLAFDNTGGYTTQIAVANLSNRAVRVPVVLSDQTGASLGTAAINLPAYGHTSFTLSANYPATAGARGEIELDTPPGGQISTLGIRTSPGGAIATIPVLAK